MLLSQVEAQLLINNAREATTLLAAMDEDARRGLAIELLVARPR